MIVHKIYWTVDKKDILDLENIRQYSSQFPAIYGLVNN